MAQQAFSLGIGDSPPPSFPAKPTAQTLLALPLGNNFPSSSSFSFRFFTCVDLLLPNAGGETDTGKNGRTERLSAAFLPA